MTNVQAPCKICRETFRDSEHYPEYKNKKILGQVKNRSDYRLTFLIMRDSFRYDNAYGNFDRVYRNSEKSDISGLLLLAQDWYLAQGFLRLLYGLGFGLGYSGGKGSICWGRSEQS